jgi:hypothetical protein
MSPSQSFLSRLSLSRRWIWLAVAAGFSLTFFPSTLFAGTSVVFSKADLDSFVELVKPEASSLVLDGRSGTFRPGPSLRFAGLEDQSFDVNLDLGAEIVGLRFSDLRSKAPSVGFETGRIRIDFPLEDREKAIRSVIGSISLRGVVLSAWLRFDENGTLVYDDGAIGGEWKGSGLLKPGWVIDGLKKVALNALKEQFERQLARPSVVSTVENGLVTWAKFSADPSFSRVTPGTISVSDSGILYEAE